jgi:DNA anti-recombination protein RmuC
MIKDESKGESGKDDLLNRIKVLEEDLSKLKKQFESSRKELENSLNYLNNAFIKKIRRIILHERKRTGYLIKQYLRKFHKRSAHDKAFTEKKDRTVVPIKRKQDSDI